MLSWQARFAVLGQVCAGAALLGCGGGSTAPMDGGTAGSSLGARGGGGGGGGGGLGGLGGGGGTAGAPAPMPTGALVYMGQLAGLLMNGTPCTFEPGATGDRWCAFVAPDPATPANGALYVVNVSQAAAGVSITCAPGDANCLKLSDDFGESTTHVATFGGDTLVYYEQNGTPFGWRPGMTAARALATADPTTFDVQFCTPSTKGTAVFCLRDLPAALQPDPTLVQSELIAGKLDGTESPPLTRIETVIRSNTADARVTHFQAGFPVPGSDTIAWSARTAAAGPEVLKLQTIGDDSSRITVASNVNRWAASPDGSRWYWLSQVDETTRAGTLQSAPYPGGADPVAIRPSTLQYDFPTTASLALVDAGKTLLAIADPVAAPATTVTLDTGVLAFVALSKQGHAVYVKTASTSAGGTTFSDLYAKKIDGTGACALTSKTDGFPFDVLFTPGGGGLAWVQRGLATINAQFTRLSDCATMNTGSNVSWTEPIGDRAILFQEGFSTSTGVGAIKFRSLDAGGGVSDEPAGLISGQVATFWVLPSGGADLVVYSVDGGGDDDGIYVRAFGP